MRICTSVSSVELRFCVARYLKISWTRVLAKTRCNRQKSSFTKTTRDGHRFNTCAVQKVLHIAIRSHWHVLPQIVRSKLASVRLQRSLAASL